MRSSIWRMLSGILIAVVFAAAMSGCSDRPTPTQPPPPGGGGNNPVYDILPTGTNDTYGVYNITQYNATSDAWDWKHGDGTNLVFAPFIDIQLTNLANKSGTITKVYLHGMFGYPNATIEGTYNAAGKYGEFVINPAAVTDTTQMWLEVTSSSGETASSYVHHSTATDDIGHGPIYHFMFVNGLPVAVIGRAPSGGGGGGGNNPVFPFTNTLTPDASTTMSAHNPIVGGLKDGITTIWVWTKMDKDWIWWVTGSAPANFSASTAVPCMGNLLNGVTADPVGAMTNQTDVYEYKLPTWLRGVIVRTNEPVRWKTDLTGDAIGFANIQQSIHTVGGNNNGYRWYIAPDGIPLPASSAPAGTSVVDPEHGLFVARALTVN